MVKKSFPRQFESYISSLYSGVLAVSEDGFVENLNQAFCDLFDLKDPIDSFIGLSSPEMISKLANRYADPAGTLERLQKILAEKKPMRGAEVAMRDGRFYLVDFIPLMVDGKKNGHIWHHQDITERKRAEEQRQKEEENQRVIFEYGGIGVAFYDLDGTILMLNKRAVKNMGGDDADQFIGKSLPELFGQEVGTAFIERFRFIATQPDPVEYEDCVPMPTGTRWFSSVLTRAIDQQGNVTGIHVYAHDITSRKQMEEELTVSEQRYRLLFDTSPDAIFLLNGQGKFVNFNKVAESRYGYSKEELASMTASDLAIPEFKPMASQKVKAALDTGANFEWQHMCKDGTKLDVEINAQPIKLGDECYIIANVRDITARKLHVIKLRESEEKQRAINAEKDKFFSILAHDLRSPFNAFLGFTQMMAEELPTMTLDQIQKIAISMRKSATNLYNLLNNLLEWSRLQRGVTTYNPELFMVVTILTESLESVREIANRKGIEIVSKVPADLQVFGDIHMIQTIIRNLVSNAVKFTRKGGHVELSAIINDDNSLQFCVLDTGIGIPEKMVGSVFTLDQNNNRPGTEGEPSTGLGLIICKEFVTKHGGEIWVESEPEAGSKFSFTIPNKKVEAQSAGQGSP